MKTVPGTERATLSQRLSRLPAGRRSKLAILALWIVIATIAGSLAIKLTQRFGEVSRQYRVWGAIAAGVDRRPRAIWVSTAVVLVALTFDIGNLSVGLPGDESFTKEVGSVTGGHLIQAHYPAGTVAPAEILATAAHYGVSNHSVNCGAGYGPFACLRGQPGAPRVLARGVVVVVAAAVGGEHVTVLPILVAPRSART